MHGADDCTRCQITVVYHNTVWVCDLFIGEQHSILNSTPSVRLIQFAVFFNDQLCQFDRQTVIALYAQQDLNGFAAFIRAFGLIDQVPVQCDHCLAVALFIEIELGVNIVCPVIRGMILCRLLAYQNIAIGRFTMDLIGFYIQRSNNNGVIIAERFARRDRTLGCLAPSRIVVVIVISIAGYGFQNDIGCTVIMHSIFDIDPASQFIGLLAFVNERPVKPDHALIKLMSLCCRELECRTCAAGSEGIRFRAEIDEHIAADHRVLRIQVIDS